MVFFIGVNIIFIFILLFFIEICFCSVHLPLIITYLLIDHTTAADYDASR